MSNRWSSDFTVAEHRDLQASAMALDYTGNIVLLAGRRYLALKRLDQQENDSTLKKFQRNSKYEVGAVEWAPSNVYKDLCAIACNQLVEIVSWGTGEPVTNNMLRSHTRVVSDINWHRHDPHLLASCSIDSFTYIWDMRDTRRPTICFSSVSGASQVRWNRVSNYILATTHEGDIKLWDQRKGTSPMQYITAHLTRIHGLDWSPNTDNHLATSSQDGTVKFFDIHNTRRPENVLNTASPVWRARYTPFGEGLVTVVVPQLRRGENGLLLWNTSNQSAPVHTFVGHTDVVLEFCWRPQILGNSDHELVTWSRDQSLRVWKVDPFMQKLCGHEPDEEQIDLEGEVLLLDETMTQLGLNGNNSTNATETITASLYNFQQEFSVLNGTIPNMEVDDLDISKRTCTLTINTNGHSVILQINFPSKYPCAEAPPTFHFCPGTSLDSVLSATLLRLLKKTAFQQLKKTRVCIESCLRRLVTALEKSNESSEVRAKLKLPKPEGELFYGFHDACVPFPRTSGAKWAHVGKLVVFGRPPNARRLSIKAESTPRSFSALAGGSMLYNSRHSNRTPVSISSFYFQDHLKASKTRSRPRISTTPGSVALPPLSPKPIRHMMTIYDAESLFFVSMDLAESYIITFDIEKMCQHNALVAAEKGRADVQQAWTLANLAANPNYCNQPNAECDEDVPWSNHPFGRNLMHSLITHYAKIGDVQTAAMLSCTLGRQHESSDFLRHSTGSKSVNHSRLVTGKWWLKPGGSPYHTIHPADTSLDGWNFPALKQHRSNSWSDSMDESRHSQDAPRTAGLLEDRHIFMYDCYKRMYADLLYRWNLLVPRAQVLKYISNQTGEAHRGVEFLTECSECGRAARGPQCTVCRRPALHCSVCRLAVKGSANCCLQCGHGGHTAHLRIWFQTQDICPTGCGCHCLVESAGLFES